MADENDTAGSELEISAADAEKLLADAVDANEVDDSARESATGDTDWKAEAARLKADAERWRTLSRKNEKSFKDTATKLQQYEDANKSEAERLQEAVASHQSRAEKAESALRRREIAEQKAPEHATAAQIRAVAKRLAGDTDEALEEDADELFALLAPAPVKAKTPDRPKERLKGGSEPDEPVEETDPRRLAAAIPRGRLH